mgnify:CR=1 FL=1
MKKSLYVQTQDLIKRFYINRNHVRLLRIYLDRNLVGYIEKRKDGKYITYDNNGDTIGNKSSLDWALQKLAVNLLLNQ